MIYNISIMRALSCMILSAALMGCAASGAPKDIQGRLDYVASVEFGWDPIGKPAVDGSIAGFVAYNAARQRILTDYYETASRIPGGFGIVDRINAEIDRVARESAGDNVEPSIAQKDAAKEMVLQSTSEEERQVYQAQAIAFGEFVDAFATSLLEAGVSAVAVEVVKDALGDSKALTQGMDFLTATRVANQIGGFSAQLDAAVEIEALVGYFKHTHEVYMSTTADS